MATTLKPLEEVDPELLDQAVRRIVAEIRRAPDREVAIANRVWQSDEVREWICFIHSEPVPTALGVDILMMRLLSAFAIGLEVGYDLGAHEAQRSTGMVQ